MLSTVSTPYFPAQHFDATLGLLDVVVPDDLHACLDRRAQFLRRAGLACGNQSYSFGERGQ
jgi:hypothetical protein